jgi:hypothetical protein
MRVTFPSVLFILWSVLGFIVGSLSMLGMTMSPQGVGVGTSAYVAAGMLYWIGGMVLFGIASVLRELYQPPAKPAIEATVVPTTRKQAVDAAATF